MNNNFESPINNGKTINLTNQPLINQALIGAVRSLSKKQASEVPCCIKLEMTDELSVKIDLLIDSLQANTDAINARNSTRGADGLLAALQTEAANDAPEPELKQLGQWVFEGQDEKWVSAAVDRDGEAFLYSVRSVMLQRPRRDDCGWDAESPIEWKLLEGKFDARYWRDSNIDRQPINDVDFEGALNEEKETLELEFLGGNPASGASVDWFGVIKDENDTPELSYSDLQRIFVQNLTTVLIQRMHSLQRFSDDESSVKSDDIQIWDIAVYWTDNASIKRFAVVQESKPWFIGFSNRTILESEIQEFREWAEAHYV